MKRDRGAEHAAPVALRAQHIFQTTHTKENLMDLDILTHAPEQKAGVPAEPLGAEDVMRIFEAYRQTNDERVSEIARRRADPLLEEKVARIDAALDGVLVRQARPPLGAERKSAVTHDQREHKAAFESYVRSGESSGLRALETKALTVGTPADGGYLVPNETESEIGRRLTQISPIRGIAGVREISGNVYKKPFMTAGPAAGWAGETDARSQTTTPTLAELSFPAMELYAMPAASATLLEDAAVNLDEWIAAEVEQVFAAQEGAAFVNGDGTNKPKGFLQYTKVAEASWSWTNIGYVVTGTSAAFDEDAPIDGIIDLVYALKAGYRQNATFVMNRKTQAAVRKLKDEEGHYLWAPPTGTNGRASLLTYPIIEAEDMPDIAANSYSIAFGDFRRGYLVVDRQGVRVLRDPFSAKPYVLFYTTKRVGGGVQDFDAIKLLKFAES
jgi:HK97 family phage major capsid protein